MPFFSMVRRPLVDTRRLTQRRSPSSQKRWVCRLGRKRRRFLLLAWETRLPTATLLPVTSQTRLIKFSENQLVTNVRPDCGRRKGRLYTSPPEAEQPRPANPVEVMLIAAPGGVTNATAISAKAGL